MLAATPTPNPVSSSEPHHVTYSVGSLTYNRTQLAILFGWLLWGDFAFTFFEQIFGRFMPLYLKHLEAPNLIIGITTGSVVGLVNLFFLPNISQWSDRLRTRIGRRIPFLLVVSPLTILSLLGIGFAPEITAWAAAHLPAGVAKGVSTTMLICTFLCVCAVAFHFFNMVLVNAYNWLQRDVVPQVVMTRFLSWFRFVGILSSTLFLWYVFPIMMSHRHEVFLAVGAFYLVAFSLMCWRVKEGTYPEPEPLPEDSNVLKRFASYFHDCLTLPIYRNAFFAYVLIIMSSCCGSFMVIFPKHTLKISDQDLGQLWAYSGAFSALVCIVFGWIGDRFRPIKICMVGIAVTTIVSVCGFFLVKDRNSFLIYSLVATIPGVAWGIGWTAFGMALFPEKAYGQFSAGMNVFGCAGLLFGNTAAGYFMDLVDSHYEYAFLWSAAFYALALIPIIMVYRDWKRHGGPNNYVPPIPDHMQ